MSLADRKRVAEAMIRSLVDGGFRDVQLSPDFGAWTLTSGNLTAEQFLHRTGLFGKVFIGKAEITVDTVTGEGDRVVVQFRVLGDLITGKVYRQNAAFMIEFDGDGRVRHWREYFDSRIVAELLFPAMKELEVRGG